MLSWLLNGPTRLHTCQSIKCFYHHISMTFIIYPSSDIIETAGCRLAVDKQKKVSACVNLQSFLYVCLFPFLFFFSLIKLYNARYH